MSDIAVIGFARSPRSEALVEVFDEVLSSAGLGRREIDFWCSGSSDYLAGRAFSFVSAVDAIGAVPPISESHVEMDAAWALYEAYVKILAGEAETALVYGFGKGSAGDLNRVLALQTDPYTVAPLWPDAISLATLQARLMSAELRPSEQNLGTDGASAVVLAAGDRATRNRDRPAWITGIAHRVDPPGLGERDLTTAPSATGAAADAGLTPDVEVAALHTPFAHQQLLLRRALGLGDDVRYLPDTGNAMFSGGLARIGAAAEEIMSGRARTAVAHATSGPLLQQNLVCTLGGTR
ncbi:lipid-transfer protein [Actinoplanes couchii]|uniref:Lipid-transfer protein n=1 Tax=Actinoplanes couchii TaxID=403638 RepID=A0ABQ3XFA2_9ACTN|nr:lipid-transfer protein [Actinoplanes couchii]MDR6321877.1 acetyl-CoA acetyltransferase [Actinoplanes couchii]GID57166.1 hypothetical protein Aco03nite_055700 [Actinoplanes couchii]